MMRTRRWWRLVAILTLLVPLAIVVTLGSALAQPTLASAETGANTTASSELMKWAFAAAAAVTAVCSLGAAYAVSVVGGAAMGAIAEKPETAGRAIVFVGLAEGIAIYGLIIAIMILGYLP